MTTKTITTKTGRTITVEMVRKVQDKVNFADGYNIVTGREIVDYTTITLRDETGKEMATGSSLRSNLSPRVDANGIAAGAVGIIGNMYLRREMYDLVAGLLAEVEAETPKSDEQIAIETAKAQAEAAHEAWYNSPEEVHYREFVRRMEAPDSDL
jgi:hypothetical protein